MRKNIRNFIDNNFPLLGYKIRLLRDDIFRSRKIKTEFDFWMIGGNTYKKYETNEANLFLRLLENSEIVVDIGANFGFYTLLAATRGKNVCSIEPSPRNLKILNKNLCLNSIINIDIYPVGLAASSGEMEIYGYSGTSSFVKGWGNSNYSIKVPVKTLDSLLYEKLVNKKILIKMDVEGFEVEVLRGAVEFLKMNPAPKWMIEVMLNGELIPGGLNKKFSSLFDIFWEFGYKCRCINNDESEVDATLVEEWIRDGKIGNDCHDFLFYKD